LHTARVCPVPSYVACVACATHKPIWRCSMARSTSSSSRLEPSPFQKSARKSPVSVGGCMAPSRLPVSRITARMGGRPFCALPTASYVGVPWYIVPKGTRTNAPWTVCRALPAMVHIELHMPQRHARNVLWGWAGPSGCKPLGGMNAIRKSSLQLINLRSSQLYPGVLIVGNTLPPRRFPPACLDRRTHASAHSADRSSSSTLQRDGDTPCLCLLSASRPTDAPAGAALAGGEHWAPPRSSVLLCSCAPVPPAAARCLLRSRAL